MIYAKYYADYNEADHGTSGNGNTIKALIDIIGSNYESIVLCNGNYYLSTNLIIPSNITLIFLNNSKIVKNASAILTINGHIKADKRKIFQGFSAGDVTGSLDVVYPEWWGAIPDGITDCTIAINSAIKCCFNTTIELGFGQYLYSSTILISRHDDVPAICIRGVHQGVLARPELKGTILKAAPAFTGDVAIAVSKTGYSARNVVLENFGIHGPGSGNANSVGIQIRGGADIIKFQNISIDNFETGIVIGRLDINEGGNSRNFFYGVEINDAVNCIKNVTNQGFVTNLFGCSFGTRTKNGVVSYRFDNEGNVSGEGNVVQIFGGEFGCWGILFDYQTTHGKSIVSGAHFEIDVTTHSAPPTIIKTMASQNPSGGSTLFIGCFFGNNNPELINTANKLIEFHNGSNLKFEGCEFGYPNPIIDISGGGSEGQSVTFDNNHWEYAPDFGSSTDVLIINDHYSNQNKKKSDSNDIRYSLSPTKLAHILHSFNGIRTEYRNAAPTSAYWKQGSIIYNSSPSAGGIPGWVCITTGKLGTLTGSIELDSNSLTLDVADPVWEFPGWELSDSIVVVGAGVAGGDLTTTISGINGTTKKFTLSNNASTTIVHATVKHGTEAVFKAMANVAV